MCLLRIRLQFEFGLHALVHVAQLMAFVLSKANHYLC